MRASKGSGTTNTITITVALLVTFVKHFTNKETELVKYFKLTISKIIFSAYFSSLNNAYMTSTLSVCVCVSQFQFFNQTE